MDFASSTPRGAPVPLELAISALDRQATAARTALPYLAQVEQTRPGWLSALDVATDAGDQQQLVDLAKDAPTPFAAGMAFERIAAVADMQRT